VLGKILAVLFVLAAVPVALWIGGYLPPPAPTAAAEEPSAVDPGVAETEWRDRVAAICVWERERMKGIRRTFRRASTPADTMLNLDSMIRLGRSSLDVFRRLEPPFAFRREARELTRLLEREQRAVLGLRDAIRRGKAGAFFRNAKVIVAVEERKRAVLADLGLDGCLPRPPSPPSKNEEKIV
jgi:hypothetical protein